MSRPDFSEVFPVGARVYCESEMWPGHWEYGRIVEHLETRFNVSWAIRIETEEEHPALVDYDYRFLDVDPRNSLVRLAK